VLKSTALKFLITWP